jgi:hypothetical protein
MSRKRSHAAAAVRLVLSVALSFGLVAVPVASAQAVSSPEIRNRPAICLHQGRLYTEKSVIMVDNSYRECRSDLKWHPRTEWSSKKARK